ncbi:MAG: hypothetical protein ABI644_14150 [Arenimonas sp.]
MRTAIFILVGFALLALLLAIAKKFKPGIAAAAAIAVPCFVVLWGIVAAANMWIGVSQAGYAVMEELPIFLVIFLLPTAAALLIKWNWR